MNQTSETEAEFQARFKAFTDADDKRFMWMLFGIMMCMIAAWISVYFVYTRCASCCNCAKRCLHRCGYPIDEPASFAPVPQQPIAIVQPWILNNT